MNNQNSEKENPSPIYFSPTGGKLPPIENENIGEEAYTADGPMGMTEEYQEFIEPLQEALLAYLVSLPDGHKKEMTSKVIDKLALPLKNKEGKKLHLYIPIMSIVPKKYKEKITGTLEYRELLEDTMQEEYNKQHLKEQIKHTNDIAEEAMKKWLNAKHDAVNHPSHYTTNTPIIRVKCECGKVIEVPIECIDVIRNMPSWKGNAIKYLWREGLKEDAELDIKQKTIQDLEKAIWYINDRIKQLKGESSCT